MSAPPLVMRCGALGDMVLLTVLLAQLRARFGTPSDLICAGRWVVSLLEEGSVGRVFVLGSRRTPFWLSSSQQRLVAWLRQRGRGPVWYCDLGAGRSLLDRAGIGADEVCDSRLFPWLPGESFTDRYLRLGGWTPPAFAGQVPAAVPGIERAAHLPVSPAARRTVDSWLEQQGLGGRPFMIVHPGCRHATRRHLRSRAGTSKHWPEERWAQVLRAVRERAPDEAILLTGTRPEAALNADVIRHAGLPDVHNVAGQLALPELIALLARARSFIGVDTGPTHAAASLGCPTVALFGTADADLYRPGGATTPAVALTGQIDGSRSILGISPESVIAAWSRLGAGDGRALERGVGP